MIIRCDELKRLLAHPPQDLVILDVREQEEVEESKIEGSVWIPLDEVSTRAPKEIAKDRDVVIYCAHGVRSLHALMALQMMGYTRVRSLEGGLCEFEQGT